MAEFQKCPVCDGTGLVNRPPGIAGDQEMWTSTSAGPWRCGHCGGQRVILRPSTAHKEGE